MASHVSQTFTITPANNYGISTVFVDGVSANAAPTYTFNNVLANHTIEATFGILNVIQSISTPSPSSPTAISSPSLSYSELVKIFGEAAVKIPEDPKKPDTTITSTKIDISPIAGVHSPGARSPNILNIQKILNSDITTQISSQGAGSPGKETNFFGPATRAAVQKFQLKYNIVKSPKDSGYGVIGPKTRLKMNQLIEQGL